MLTFKKNRMQRGVEQKPPKKTGGFYSTPLLEGSAFINARNSNSTEGDVFLEPNFGIFILIQQK
jgi:hypothetical protein